MKSTWLFALAPILFCAGHAEAAPGFRATFSDCLWKAANARSYPDLQSLMAECPDTRSYCANSRAEEPTICISSLALLATNIQDASRAGLRGFPTVSSADVTGNPNIEYDVCMLSAYGGPGTASDWGDCLDQYQSVIGRCAGTNHVPRGQCEAFFAAEANRYLDQFQ